MDGDSQPSASTLLTRLSGTGMKEGLHSALSNANLIPLGDEQQRSDSTSANFPIANSIGKLLLTYLLYYFFLWM